MNKYRVELIACCIGMVSVAANANLVSNGSFESDPVGTQVSIFAPTQAIDTSTFTDWRVFSVGAPPIEEFTVASTTNASVGNLALQLDWVDLGNAASDNHSLDRSASKISVTPGVKYTLSFDAAWISGSPNLQHAIAEFDAGGNFLGQEVLTATVSNSSYQTFTYAWTPSTNATAEINLIFKPVASGASTNSSLLLDNIDLTVAPSLLTDWDFEANNPDAGWGFRIGAGLVAETGPNSAPGDGISMGLTPVLPSYTQIISKAVPIASAQPLYLALDYKQLAGGTGNIVVQTRYYAGVGANGFSEGGGGTLLGEQSFTLPTSAGTWSTWDTYSTNSIPNNWPAADYVEVRVIGNAFGIPQEGTVLVDNIKLTTTPDLPDPIVAPTILSLTPSSSGIMRMVVDAPISADRYSLEGRADLGVGGWSAVPHSDDGLNPFILTNLSYSTAEGTNEVIYVEANTSKEFFKIIGE